MTTEDEDELSVGAGSQDSPLRDSDAPLDDELWHFLQTSSDSDDPLSPTQPLTAPPWSPPRDRTGRRRPRLDATRQPRLEAYWGAPKPGPSPFPLPLPMPTTIFLDDEEATHAPLDDSITRPTPWTLPSAFNARAHTGSCPQTARYKIALSFDFLGRLSPTNVQTYPGEWQSQATALLQAAFPELQQAGFDYQGCLQQLATTTLRHRLWTPPEELADLLCTFAGADGTGAEHRKKGRRTISLDLSFSEDHDCLTAEGLRTYLGAITYTNIHSAELCGMVCGPWGWLSRFRTGRRPHNPLGSQNIQITRDSNKLLLACYLGWTLGWAVSNRLILEHQPQGLAPQVPWVDEMFQARGIVPTITYQGLFHGRYLKPTAFWSDLTVIKKLKRKRPTKAFQKLCYNHGRWRQGLPRALGQSAQYPTLLCRALSRLLDEECRSRE